MLELISASEDSSDEESFTVFATNDFGEKMMVLDNQSKVHIFGSQELLRNSAIFEARNKCSIGGVDKKGPRLRVTKEGIYDD
jgi:hypothetical protein